MAKKRDKQSDTSDSGQTMSETTAAAHTIFNNPEQPQRPITVENINKTVENAVAKAFAEQEKQDVKKLKIQTKSSQVPTSIKQEKKTKGRFKTDQVPTTVRQDKIRGHFKTDQVPFNEVEQSPSKPKIKIKNPTPFNAAPEEKINTPTGISINELAERIQKQEPTSSKPKIKIKNPTPFNVVPNKTEEPLASAVLGKTATPVANPDRSDITTLQKKVDALEESKKVEKVSAPMTADEKKQSRSDAAQALAALGFKKNEFQGLLDKVDHIESTTEKIRMVLKLKADPLTKIPKAELPAAIEQAKVDTKEPIKVEAAKSPPPKTPKLKTPEQLDLNLQQPPEPLELKPSPGKIGPPVPVVTATPVSAPKVPAKTPAPNNKDDLDQALAQADKEREDRKKKEKEEAERQKRIEKQLKEIQEKIGSHGIFDLISQGISSLLKSLIPTLLGPLLSALPSMLGALGKAGLVIGVGVAAYEGTKFLLEKAGYTGETLGRFFSGQDESFQKHQNAFNKYENKDAIVGRLNDKLKGTGFTALGAGQYKDAQGHTIKATDLPPDVQSKINLTTAKAVDAKTAVTSKLEAQAPKAQSDMASQKIVAPTPTQAQDTPEIHVHQDNRQTNLTPPASSSNDGGALIKVRNDEPTAAGLIASIFEHPVSYGAVYRM